MDSGEPDGTGDPFSDPVEDRDDPAVRETIQILDALLPQPRRFDIQLWNGLILPGETAYRQARPFRMVLNHPGAARNMFRPPLELALGEAYIYGDFELEGDLLEAVSLMDDLFGEPVEMADIAGAFPAWLRLPRMTPADREQRRAARLDGKVHSIERDTAAIRYHYDVGNEFYSLWLGKRMLYSCAYFQAEDDDLDAAQEAKLEHICRKILLKPGDSLLDIGCGWGGLAVYAAEKYQARVTGITLSAEQFSLARERVEQAGLKDRVEILLKDYREVAAESFDRITSVGMVEHVGRAKLPDYFAQAWRLLKPGGLFLNHAISSRLPAAYTARDEGHGGHPAALHVARETAAARWFRRSVLGLGLFQQKYFFPDGELESVSEMNLAAEKAGFEVRDVENLREHYGMTLERWVRNMEASREGMVRCAGEVTYRTWRLYMAVAAHGFRSGRSSIHQSLLAKPERGRTGLPLTRRHLYVQ